MGAVKIVAVGACHEVVQVALADDGVACEGFKLGLDGVVYLRVYAGGEGAGGVQGFCYDCCCYVLHCGISIWFRLRR